MKQDPVVSCITIFLNAERWIREAIQSVFDQTFSKWELLLVDDGSTDSSSAIARQYAADFPGRVRYLEHEGHRNLGMSAARNLGIRNARGSFIAFLDADDVWLPEKLAQQVALFEAHPEAALVYGRTLIWHSWTGKSKDQRRDHFLPLGVPANTLVEPPELFFLLLANKVQTPTTCNAMIRKEACLEVGGFVDSFRGMYEDQVFFSMLLLKKPVYVAEACWAKYRQPESNRGLFSTADRDYCVARRPFLEWLGEHLATEGVEQRARVEQALRKEISMCRFPRLLYLQQTFWIVLEQVRGWAAQLAGRTGAVGSSR